MDGDWDSPDITAFLELVLVNGEAAHSYAHGKRGVGRFVERIRHWMNANTKTGSKRNISAHYDLGNDFYKQWLDPSDDLFLGALFDRRQRPAIGQQNAKYRVLAEATGIKPGDHVLEIGCGWGGFAEFAAGELNCRVTGLTISREQLAFAQERIRKAGLSDRVDFRFQDYRDETGVYDRIVSIEMFEAVGEKYWPAYFSKLKPMPEAGRQGRPTDHHHPSRGLRAISQQPGFHPELRLPRRHAADAPPPGRTWHGRWICHWSGTLVSGLTTPVRLPNGASAFGRYGSVLRPMGFDERFKRLWEFYLFYCEAGFRARNIDVRQVVFSRSLTSLSRMRRHRPA